ncbi:hypothetical protein ERHA55_29530 [Erwinia rhapontici]|uniref:BON domain-containing protein n=1 Tax=Erwinia rhapontici TaxID=55212 RepID=A0ABM7N1E9_ERWRD|nr:hypothetical protein ERHA53_26250 [Erwinia rhapontici]BCQ45426.1 hypothetical protein ERHA55_29530 [Erwinia rhapontici]
MYNTGIFIDYPRRSHFHECECIITTKVKAGLLNDKSLKSTEINVETFKGRVQLSGFVSSPQAANRAVQVTRGVAGVKSVVNNMQIK